MLPTVLQNPNFKALFHPIFGSISMKTLRVEMEDEDDDDPDGIENRWVDTKLVIQAYSIRELVAGILLRN